MPLHKISPLPLALAAAMLSACSSHNTPAAGTNTRPQPLTPPAVTYAATAPAPVPAAPESVKPADPQPAPIAVAPQSPAVAAKGATTHKQTGKGKKSGKYKKSPGAKKAVKAGTPATTAAGPNHGSKQ